MYDYNVILDDPTEPIEVYTSLDQFNDDPYELEVT